MTQQTTAPTAPLTVTASPVARDLHRVECQAGRPKLISNVLPTQGYTALCQRCQSVHLIPWDSLPTEVLRGIAETISKVLVARASSEV